MCEKSQDVGSHLKIAIQYHEIVVVKTQINREIWGSRILRHPICESHIYIYISQHSHVFLMVEIPSKNHGSISSIPSHSPQNEQCKTVLERRSHLWTKAGDMDAKLPVGDLVPPEVQNDYHEAGYPIKQTNVYVLCIHIHIHIHIHMHIHIHIHVYIYIYIYMIFT